MITSFTGTTHGMTQPQFDRVVVVYEYLQPSRIHHGCCRGADRAFHEISWASARMLHPSNEEQHQWALKNSKNPDVIYDITPPLSRNHIMAEASTVLIATPRSKTEILRSGTWATIRYARKLNRMIYLCWPDGSYTVEIGKGSIKEGFLRD